MRITIITLALVCRLATTATAKETPSTKTRKELYILTARQLEAAMEGAYKRHGLFYTCEREPEQRTVLCTRYHGENKGPMFQDTLTRACGGIDGCTTCWEVNKPAAAFRCRQTKRHGEWATYMPKECYGKNGIAPICREIYDRCVPPQPADMACLERGYGELIEKYPNTKIEPPKRNKHRSDSKSKSSAV